MAVRDHEQLPVDGAIVFSSWLGVHALLMSGVRNRIDAFVSWGWDYFSKTRGPQVHRLPPRAIVVAKSVPRVEAWVISRGLRA